MVQREDKICKIKIRKMKKVYKYIIILIVFATLVMLSILSRSVMQFQRDEKTKQVLILSSITVLYLNASFILDDYKNITNVAQLRAFLRDKNKMKEWRAKYNFKDANIDDLDVLEAQYGASNIFFNSNMKLWDLDSEIGSEIDTNDIALMLHFKDKYFVRHFREGGGKVLKTNEFLLTGRNALYLKNE